MGTMLKTVAAAFAVLMSASVLAADAPVYREMEEGNAKAKVTVIEYASLTCSHCGQFHNESYPQLKKDYIDTGKIKFIYRDMPGDGLALGAALLARCAPGDKGKAMIGMMYKNQNEWVTSEDPLKPLTGYAKLAGMDQAAVDACVQNKPIMDKLMEHRQSALDKGAKYTPTFFVGDVRLDGGDYGKLKAAIDAALK